jgi:digeranylgeranylglycerophospholipid reductase
VHTSLQVGPDIVTLFPEGWFVKLYDVIVVGGGPAGSYVADELATRGHRVVVLEQHKKVGKAACCSGIVGKDCLDAFPISRQVILREARAARFFAPSGRRLRVEKETTQAYIVDRLAFDAEIAGRAQTHGAEYCLDSPVTGISTTPDSARVQVKRNGRAVSVEGKTVVIASGFGSRLPQMLGFGRSGDFVMGAQAEVETRGTDEVEVYFGSHTAPGFFAWLVPTSENRALAGLLSRHHTGPYLRAFLRRLAEQGKIASPHATVSYGGIPLKPAPRTFSDRSIVVGDAAGQVKPTTGGGIYYGLLCARTAADTLHEAISNGDFSARALSAYEKKWKGLLSGELRTGRRARWLFERLNDRQIEHFFELAESRDIPGLLLDSADFSFDWHGKLITKGARYLGAGGVLSLLWSFVWTVAPDRQRSWEERHFARQEAETAG